MCDSDRIVCVVDDDESVRRSLKRLLEASGFRVETFADAEAYLSKGDGEACACLVLDVRMPGIDGLALQKRLAERGATASIVFLTGHGDIPMSVHAIKAGAVDFLTKPVDETVLLAAVSNAMGLYLRRAAEADAVADIRELIAGLTPREREVMRCMITGAANKQIAETLGIAEKTVKIHRSRVMKKLGVGSVAQLLQVCQRAGIEAPPGIRAM